jgi:hypothetical protein
MSNSYQGIDSCFLEPGGTICQVENSSENADSLIGWDCYSKIGAVPTAWARCGIKKEIV